MSMNQIVASIPVVPPSGSGKVPDPDPEVNGKPVRRRFTGEYKLRIVREAQASSKPGAIGALLRREGLYTSHLSQWRRQWEEGALKGLSPKKRGRKPARRNLLAEQVVRLQREKAKLEQRLKQAEAIIGIQKKACELLGIPPAPDARTPQAKGQGQSRTRKGGRIE